VAAELSVNDANMMNVTDARATVHRRARVNTFLRAIVSVLSFIRAFKP
jgi:hypothetical protein